MSAGVVRRELWVRATWSVQLLSPKSHQADSSITTGAGWYRRPGLLASIVLVITIALYIIF